MRRKFKLRHYRLGGELHFDRDRPVVLRRYRNRPAALVEKSALDAAGIECFLQDDKLARMDWLGNAIDWIKLLVRENDAEEAGEILRQAAANQPSKDDNQES